MTRQRRRKAQDWGPLTLAFTEADAYRKARELRGLTLEFLAKRAGLDKGVVGRIEDGKRVNESSKDAVLKALRLTREDIQSAILRSPPAHMPDWLLDAKRAAMEFARAIDRGSSRDGPHLAAEEKAVKS